MFNKIKFFSNRVINDWNSLPTNIVNANSINAMEGDVPGDNEVDEGSLIVSEDPDNESTV